MSDHYPRARQLRLACRNRRTRGLLRTRQLRCARLAVVATMLVTTCVLVGCGRGPFVALRSGQCLPDGAGVEGRRAQAPRTVDCSKPHRYEVFAVVPLTPPTDEWPGEETVSVNAEALCVDSIEAATGLDPADTPDDVALLHIDPTESSWRDGDRDVECLFRWDHPTTQILVGP